MPAPAARPDLLAEPADEPSGLQVAARTVMGLALVVAGIGHLTNRREEFQAQVPRWVPLDEDLVVVASGVVEIVLGLALLALLVPALARLRAAVGLVVAAFFVAIFPGNVGQWLEGVDAFGLESGTARFVRLLFQPPLVAVALWSTGAWAFLARWWRARRT